MEKVEIRYVGGPLDGTAGEYEHPLPLGLRMTTARKPITRSLVTEDQLEPGGALYRLSELLSGEWVYVAVE